MSEKCEDYHDKTKKLGCYAKHAASSFKRGAIKATHWHGGQEEKHPWGYFVLAVLVVSGVFILGGAMLSYNPVSNPTASQVTYTTTWALSNGTTVVSGQTISGTLNTTVRPSASAVTEVSTWNIGGTAVQLLTPYWIMSVTLKVYPGSSASGTPVITAPFAVNSTTYTSTMQAWVNNYLTSIQQNLASPSKWVLGDTPMVSPLWMCRFDTRNLANGAYTFQIAIAWSSGISGGIVSVGPPPSLSSPGGSVYLLSFFGYGVQIPEGEDYTWLYVFFAVVAVGAITISLVKRR